MNLIRTLVAWMNAFSQEFKTTFRLQQEAQARQYAQQRLQQMLAVAYPHYIPFAGGVLRCFAALGKKFPEFIIPSRVEDVILPPLERVAPDGKGGVMFRFRAQWKRPMPEVVAVGHARLQRKPTPLVPVAKLEAVLTQELPNYLGPCGYGVRWVRVIEEVNDRLTVEIGGVHTVDAAKWKGAVYSYV